jgi:hypothetical protein
MMNKYHQKPFVHGLKSDNIVLWTISVMTDAYPQLR